MLTPNFSQQHVKSANGIHAGVLIVVFAGIRKNGFATHRVVNILKNVKGFKIKQKP